MYKRSAQRTIIVASTLFCLFLTSCHTKKRDSFVTKEDSQKIFEATEISDITNEKFSSLHFFNQEQLDKAQKDDVYKGLTLVLVSDKIKNLLEKITEAEAPDFKSKPIALMIYQDELKVFSVQNMKVLLASVNSKLTPDFIAEQNEISQVYVNMKEKKIFSLQELKIRKKISKEKNPVAVQNLLQEMSSQISSADFIEAKGTNSLRFKLIASFKIDNQGILARQKNDYDEEKSAASVMDHDAEFATHLKISGERSDKVEEKPEEPNK